MSEQTAERAPAGAGRGEPILSVRDATRHYRSGDSIVKALDGVSLDLAEGGVTALMGRNGSGKSTMMWTLQGTLRSHRGSVSVAGTDPGAGRGAPRLVGLVPQTPSDLTPREKTGELYKFATSDLYADLRGAIGIAIET